MKFIRYLAVVVLSVILGGIIGYFVSKIASSYHFIDISGGLFDGVFGPNKSDNTLGLMISAFLGMLSGVFISILLSLVFVTEVFSKLDRIRLFFIVLVIGVIHSLIRSGLEYNNAIYGGRMLDQFAKKIILTTAILEFITGFLIAGICLILIKFLVLNKS